MHDLMEKAKRAVRWHKEGQAIKSAKSPGLRVVSKLLTLQAQSILFAIAWDGPDIFLGKENFLPPTESRLMDHFARQLSDNIGDAQQRKEQERKTKKRILMEEKSMKKNFLAEFLNESKNRLPLFLCSPGLIWTHGSLMISPTKEEDLNTSQINLTFTHVVLSHLEEITLYRFMGNVLHILSHPVAFCITDAISFEIPKMVSDSYEPEDYFQVLVRID
ncbi:hypothetical protein llap_8904 [Limosa lapponica baueri]|uniref:Uncharacterized protein n=1 Tax=Limosa lapponica baueri TaxID=1758121 RepID=A0A2I0U489_LIMLA|nr:hypothetical protein llap_8904 [Limosa lapponica baueri]